MATNDDNENSHELWSMMELHYGGILGGSIDQPDLTNDIHPLFQYQSNVCVRSSTEFSMATLGPPQTTHGNIVQQHEWNFYDVAFRLATRLMTTDHFFDWWVILAYGRIDPEDYLLKLRAEELLDLRVHTHAKLQDMARHVTFTFGPTEGECSYPVTSNMNSVVLDLDEEFLQFAREALRQPNRGWDPSIASDTLRMQWRMAITLCHKSSHVFWQWRHANLSMSVTTPEPLHSLSPRGAQLCRLGVAWELWMLGFGAGTIDPDQISGHRPEPHAQPTSKALVACGRPVQSSDSRSPELQGVVLRPVPMININAFFREATWARVRAGTFHFDRPGFMHTSHLAIVINGRGHQIARLEALQQQQLESLNL